jgi:hypothetical protein
MSEKVVSKKLTEQEFWYKAIETLKKEGYKGIHLVYSGANAAFRKYFEGADPKASTERLATEGKLIVRPTKGGAMIYHPSTQVDSTDVALTKMGLK